MKKSLFAGILAFALILEPLVASRRAQALVGLGTVVSGGAGVPFLVAGGAMVAAGGIVTLATGLQRDPDTGNVGWDIGASLGRAMGEVTGVALMVIGVIVLDDDAGAPPVLKFTPLDGQSAAALSIAPDELEAYSRNLDELNAVAQSVGASLGSDSQPTLEKSAALWDAYRDEFPAEALSAAAKVSAQLRAP